MIREIIKKKDFVPFNKIGVGIYKISFNKNDIVEDVFIEDSNGNQNPTGEKRETDYCNVTSVILKYKPNPEAICNILTGDGNLLNINDAATILSNFTEEPIPYLRKLLLHNIDTYDTSAAVNSFILGGKQMWLPKETRVGLVNSITIEKAAGKDTTTFWFGDEKYELPVDTALQMLSALELYAVECFQNTARHVAKVNSIDSIEELVSFDYKNGYPEKLNF